MTEENVWRRCGSCKKNIELNQKYYACDISTCRKTAYCSMPCFDAHVPVFRHKDAWAEERMAPKVMETTDQVSRIATARIVSNTPKADELPREVLVVASKLKDYIRVKSNGMNTSANVLDRLSDMIRQHCNKAIERAASDNRKTVMDRDFYL